MKGFKKYIEKLLCFIKDPTDITEGETDSVSNISALPELSTRLELVNNST